jgi:hypothetical protein
MLLNQRPDHAQATRQDVDLNEADLDFLYLRNSSRFGCVYLGNILVMPYLDLQSTKQKFLLFLKFSGYDIKENQRTILSRHEQQPALTTDYRQRSDSAKAKAIFIANS